MSESGSRLFPENGPNAQRHAPATLRNRDAIVEALRDILPESGTILEVASGTGEHAVYFGRTFPHLTIQPSDPDPENHQSIRAWTEREALSNILPPLALDALHPEWDVAQPAAILCINMVHIAPWEASIGLFEKASRLLQAGTPFYLYGPYFQADVPPAEGNLAFERSLKSRNLQWGIRDVADMDALAEKTGFRREKLVNMPANNISLIYRRQ
ncbi:Protein of unknown function [Parasphingorhabdus marina DSM 22363]|uniref:SAM-dependent methyltransferase n=1 Tax=Parasphingorhabdus marina DSM 22363 TaxID=1123272 RepID=A0A1N6GSR9_9SPHN|nr:DUF938 domain-containing protein [Parasphingorhabdus marina]SIO10576.1 Protein of unknown function [Parasphingorhabdus marina DSM 22363]